MSSPNAVNMYDVIGETTPVFNGHRVQYRVLGGAATMAMTAAEAYDPQKERIFVPPSIMLDTERPNGTLRDVDYLIMTTDPEKIEEIHRDVTAAVGGKAVVSVFGFPKHEDIMARSPWSGRFMDFTSERTIDSAGNVFHVCHPIVQPVQAASYRPWTAEIDGIRDFSTLSPASHYAAYMVRSLGGQRPRDRAKMEDLRHTMRSLWPDLAEYEANTLSEWYEFRDLMSSLSATDEGLDSLMLAARRPIIRFLDSQEWAIELAQGGGPFGKLVKPVLGKFMREATSDDETAKKPIGELEQKYIAAAQKISEMTGGIITPGNVLSTLSLIITSHGITHMDDLSGIAEIAVGESLDLIDGKEARRTGTASKLGASVDAGFDKAKMAFSLYMSARKGILPPAIAAEIAGQNLANAGLTLYGESQGVDMAPNVDGKRTRFIQVTSMASFMFANYLDTLGGVKAKSAAKALRAAGWGAFAYQLKTGYDVTKGLADMATGKTVMSILEADENDKGYREDPAERLFPYAA